jgi:hypothetical protein
MFSIHAYVDKTNRDSAKVGVKTRKTRFAKKLSFTKSRLAPAKRPLFPAKHHRKEVYKRAKGGVSTELRIR